MQDATAAPAQDQTRMAALVAALAEAKSRQDVDAAMQIYHPEGVLEAPPLGVRREGSERMRSGLKSFFSTFPDYTVILENQAVSGETLIAWGSVHLTLTRTPSGQAPNGVRATLPVFILFGFREDKISWESFHFDLASLCRQSGVSLDAFTPGEG